MKPHPLVERLAQQLADSDAGLLVPDVALTHLAESLAELDGTPALAAALEGIMSFAAYLGDHHDGPPAAMTLLGLIASAARRMSGGDAQLEDLGLRATAKERSLDAIGAAKNKTPVESGPAPEGASKNQPWLRFSLVEDFEKKGK